MRTAAPSVPRNALVFLAIFLAAALGWAGVNWVLFRPGVPKAALPDPGNRARLARIVAAAQDILDRPLFSSDRSPPPLPPTKEQLAVLQRPVLKSHLLGITVGGGTRAALFASDDHKYNSVAEGEEIEGFKVKSIAADRVILVNAFGEQVVQPSKGLAPTVQNTKPVELGTFDPDKPDKK